MELRPLGSTGIRVSVLGIGTVKLGRTRGLKYPTPSVSQASAGEWSGDRSGRSGGEGSGEALNTLPSDEQIVALLTAAQELGINLIDTAPAYGSSEQRLGDIMSRQGGGGGGGWLSGHQRERWVICTKAGEEFDDASGQSRYDFSPAHVRMSVERSLKRLRVECLDIVLVHSDGRDDWILRESGAIEELERLRDQGKLRVPGISTKSRAGGLAAVQRLAQAGNSSAVAGGAGCAGGGSGGGGGVVMITYNQEHQDEAPVIDAAARSGVGILLKKALSSGHASDPAQAIRFALRHPGVSSVIVGTISPTHLEANAAAAMNG